MRCGLGAVDRRRDDACLGDPNRSTKEFVRSAQVVTTRPRAAQLNPGRPIDSALFLATREIMEAPEDGLLYAWEIIDESRVSADLVVLSACNTGVGDVLMGEGVLGLRGRFTWSAFSRC